MTTAVGAIAPALLVEGSPMSERWLERLLTVRVERATNLIGRATIRFLDNGYALSASDTFSLGTRITIALADGKELLSGTVTGISLEQFETSIPELVVVVDDAAYKLTRGTRFRTHLNGTYQQAIEALAGGHGLSAEVSGAEMQSEYLLQTGSDLDFLNAIATRLGLVWYIDEGTLVVKPITLSAPDAVLTLGDDLENFSVRASGLRPTEMQVDGWDPAMQQDLSGTSVTPSDTANSRLLESYSGDGPGIHLPGSKAAVTLVPLDDEEATTLAASLHSDFASAAVVARGVAGASAALRPGVTVQIVNAGPASGEYLLTAVEHTYDRRGFQTRFTAGSRRPAGLVDTLGGPAPASGFTEHGLIIAVVTDIADPDTAGRVKVRYVGLSGQVESPWARVVSAGGGSARGMVFQPEVHDEVLVGFERGDTRRPVVLGGLFSAKNTLPTAQGEIVENGEVNYRRITSRRNHLIEIADGDGENVQHILLRLGTAEHRLRLGADRFDLELTSGRPLSIKAGDSKFEITDSGDVSIEGINVTIKASASLQLQGGDTASLKSDAQVQVQGVQVQVQADGVASVQADGPLTLKGATVAIN